MIKKRFWASIWVPILAIIGFWQLLTSTGVLPIYLISTPAEIAKSFYQTIADGTLLLHAVRSSLRLTVGIAIGAPVGAALAIFAHIGSRRLQWLTVALNFLSQVPPVAWVPLTIAVAGIQDGSKVLLVAICTFFVIFVAVQEGCSQISGKLTRLLRIYKQPLGYLMYNFYFRGTAPYFFSGLRLSVTIGWIVLISAELVGSSDGLGWFVWDSRNFGRSSEMMVGVISLGILGVALHKLIDSMSSSTLQWHPTKATRPGGVWTQEDVRT